MRFSPLHPEERFPRGLRLLRRSPPEIHSGDRIGNRSPRGAHAAVAGITNTHLSWEAGTFNQPIGFSENAESDSKGVALYSAGLAAQLVASEVVLQIDCIDKNDAFVRGFMLYNILNPILYSIDYWFIRSTNKENGNSYQGDIEGIEHYSNERTAQGFAIGIFAIAAFQGYRYVKTQTWAPEWMQGETHNLGFAPMPAGGMLATYTFRF